MGLTTFTREQKHLTPVVMVGGAFVLGNLSVFLVSTLKEMQAKSHAPGGVDWFDFAILLAGMVGCIAINLAAFMNRTYGRYADQKDEDRKIETATLLREQATREQTAAEGHLR